MESIKVSNLRCIANSTSIEIKPISLLVGANSSGKSTLLRMFPLLKQSHEMRTLGGLVLNEGDVNFGFFNEALHKDADPAELKIEFGFTLQHGWFQGTQWNKFLIDSIAANCELTYVKRAKDQRYPSLRAVDLALNTTDEHPDAIKIVADEDGKLVNFTVNELHISEGIAQLRLRIGRGIIPRLVLELETKDESDLSFAIAEPGTPFNKQLLEETDAFFHGKTLRDTRLAMLDGIRIGSPQQMLELMRNAGVSTWRDRVRDWTSNSANFRSVRNLLLAKRINELLGSVDVYVSQLARSVHYFAPVRASVQRDYLSRDVSVVSVDPSGSNVAMVLSSMPSPTLGKFREWMRAYFGFEVFPQSVGDGARIALRMKEAGSGAEFNLADTGFGFSQMLPFLVQIWSLMEGRGYPHRRIQYGPIYRYPNNAVPTNFLIAIEQPELHLHPALQAKLADLFVAMTRLSREQGVPIRFMLETHSPTIIERIGQSIESKALEPNDVQAILFELDREHVNNNTAKVHISSFDSQGVLLNWPFGFLSAPVTETVSQ
jgi:hypothetical protein